MSAVVGLAPAGSRMLVKYAVLTWVTVVLNALGFARLIEYTDTWTALFAATALLGYAAVYTAAGLAPAMALSAAAWVAGRLRPTGRVWRRMRWGVFGLAVAGAAGVHFVLYLDRVVYGMYRMHLDNGFVLNLVHTPGGIESTGASGGTKLTFAAIALGFAALQTGILLALWRIRRLAGVMDVVVSRAGRTILGVLLACCLAFQAIGYGVADFTGDASVLTASNAFPFYAGVTFQGLGTRLGFTPRRASTGRIKLRGGSVLCPLKPLRRRDNPPRHNVLWLVAESWRADMLDPAIMPETWRFSQGAVRFTSHYSTGNGTRMGLFGMFYGLYAPYWFPVKDARQAPVLMDFLADQGYDIHAYTSARFSYPEFDQTVFAHIPPDRLHAYPDGAVSWRRDRTQVGKILADLANRPKDKPFFRFMFFESPHAPYEFPPECTIREPYEEDMNYATMNLRRDIKLIRNRYINACNHLDSQLARLFAFLREADLLDSTIVVVTGDHGEEFMEHGHWGHALRYPEQQVRVPLILRAPGQTAQTVTRMTSHLDLAPTVLGRLGVENDPADYCLGFDLFGPTERTFTVMGDWNQLAIRTEDLKTILPFRSGRFAVQQVWTDDDVPVADAGRFNREHGDEVVRIAGELARFMR